ncbi:MAG: VOC family protein, partial [Actinomycetota bacterium]
DIEPDGDGLPDPLPDFTDVREIERRITDAGIELMKGTETDSGPDHIVLTDPDGNVVMIDQFY